MRKIFIFWIVFLIILFAGIILAISIKSALRSEERRAAELRESIMSRPSRSPEMPTAGEKAKEEVAPLPKPPDEAAKETAAGTEQPSLPSSTELPPLEDIPVQINTNSLEIAIPAPSSEQPLNPSQDEEPSQALPAAGQ